MGPLLVDRVAATDGSVREAPGGNAVIVSGTAALLGVPTALGGQVGDDDAGRRLRARLAALGVDVAGLRAVPGRATKRADLRLRPDGGWDWLGSEPARFPYLAADQVAAIVAAGGAGARLHVAGLPPLLRAAPEATRTLVAGWRAAGRAIGFGLARFEEAERAAVAALIAPDDLLFATAAELGLLVGAPLPAAAAVLAALPCLPYRRCVVTLGADGAVLRWDDALGHERAAAAPVASTVGAGDVLSAAFLAALRRGEGPARALVAGVAAGAARVRCHAWDSWLTDRP